MVAFGGERVAPRCCHGCRSENLVNTDVLAHPRVGSVETPQHFLTAVWVYRAQPVGPVKMGLRTEQPSERVLL
jgi:hypothetical protein